jgi:lambda family phage tail tape measure protein
MANSDVLIQIGGEMSGYEKVIGQVRTRNKSVTKQMESDWKSVDKSITTALGFLTAGYGFGKIIGYVKEFSHAGEKLEESLMRINAIYGDTSGLEKWANGSVKALGMSKTEALDAASSLANLFDQLGEGATISSENSKALIQLAADIASFRSVDGGAATVLEAMNSALIGRVRGMKRYIPTLTAARIEEQALLETGKKNKDNLTDLEKANATVTVMLNGAGEAAGNFAKRTESLRNQQAMLHGNLGNISALIGEKLNPALAGVYEDMNKWITANDEFIKQNVQDKIGTLTSVIGDLMAIYKSMPSGAIETGLIVGILGRSTSIGAMATAVAILSGELKKLFGLPLLESPAKVISDLVKASSDASLATGNLFKYAFTDQQYFTLAGSHKLVNRQGGEVVRQKITFPEEGSAVPNNDFVGPVRKKYSTDEIEKAQKSLEGFKKELDQIQMTSDEFTLRNIREQIKQAVEDNPAKAAEIKAVGAQILAETQYRQDAENYAKELDAKAEYDLAYNQYKLDLLKQEKEKSDAVMKAHSEGFMTYVNEKKDMTDRIMQLTLSEKDYQIWALKQETDARRNQYENDVNLSGAMKDELLKQNDDYYKASVEKINGSMSEEIKNAMTGWASSWSSMLNDMLWNSDATFGDMLKSFGQMLTQMIIQKKIAEPFLEWGSSGSNWASLFSGIFGSGGSGGATTSALSAVEVGSARGNVFAGMGIGAYENSIVSRPTLFPFARGVGLMGEGTRPEGILPLARTRTGDLGVQVAGGGSSAPVVNVYVKGNTVYDEQSMSNLVTRISASVAQKVAPGAVISNYMKDGSMRSLMKKGY